MKVRNHTIVQQYLELTLIKHWPNGSSIASGLAKTPESTQAHPKTHCQVPPNICRKFPTFNNRTGKQYEFAAERGHQNDSNRNYTNVERVRRERKGLGGGIWRATQQGLMRVAMHSKKSF